MVTTTENHTNCFIGTKMKYGFRLPTACRKFGQHNIPFTTGSGQEDGVITLQDGHNTPGGTKVERF
jgi:hypothetical protein